MVKDHVLSNCDQYKKASILRLAYIYTEYIYEYHMICKGSRKLSNWTFLEYLIVSHLPHPIALSVSMEVFAPYKIAEIKVRHSKEGVPDPRIYNINFVLSGVCPHKIGRTRYIHDIIDFG